jgi:hypothetical protein
MLKRGKYHVLALACVLLASGQALALPSCDEVASQINQRLHPKLDSRELAEVLTALAHSQFRQLPPKYINKRNAEIAGWSPGKDLWSIPALQGKSIGGDRFGNRERALPNGQWREADLHYRGGKRGAKRLLFSSDGQRYVTVDHYRTFTEVAACR